MKKLLRISSVFTSFIFLFWTGNAIGQIDSVNVSIHFETGQSPVDSMLTTDILEVDIAVYDIDFFGEAVVSVYDAASSDYPVSKIKMTKQEFIDESQLNGSVVTMKFYGIDPQGSYRIDTQVRNYQGANFQLISTNHNIQ